MNTKLRNYEKENQPSVSIITVVFNNKNFIEGAIKSVLSQTYQNIEYIVIDGGSIDGTKEIIEKYGNKIAKFVSEPDKGIYDAMNKGLKLATGKIVGILNSDDFYADKNVIEKVVKKFEETKIDCLWSDLVYVDRKDVNKIVRFWKSSEYTERKFRMGGYPPHPTFFVKKEIYDKYGLFNLNFKIAADIEIMLRFLERFKISSAYISEVLVKMRIGGISAKNIKNIIKANIETYRAWKVNGLKMGFWTIFLKPLSKISQLIKRK
ncbi:MAG: glycosyltransferase family 2 protein [Patescibacteria group bacterium]|nr:glycosyltransferase family 2 protein [Patescibacteria group bacterium]